MIVAIVSIAGCAGPKPSRRPAEKAPAVGHAPTLSNQAKVARWQEEARAELAKTQVQGDLDR